MASPDPSNIKIERKTEPKYININSFTGEPAQATRGGYYLRSCSNPAQQNQDQKDHDHETEPSSAIVTGSIKGAAPDPAEAA
jgi:hypothetical protein